MVNWHIHDNGTLQVYYDNMLLFEISECAKCSDKNIEIIIENELNSMGYKWLENGETVYIN